ncbi:hypothetical protein ACFVVM_11765 [Nocardia sp. NPDC058176]|uniref:hypothetical protein n=1 Tax=Nocardia sp. NPDC058176 TaxID=3346368 RepID=UPI0036DE57BD
MYQFPPDPVRRPAAHPKRWSLIAVVIGVVLVLVAAGALALRGQSGTNSAGTTGDSSSTTELRVTARVDLSQPYRNTPAEAWPEGEAGIVVPPAAPIGRYSADQVATAMAKAAALISASRLNRHVLETHDVEPVLALLSPHQADALREQLGEGDEIAAAWLSIRISPDYTLLPVTPRVTGKMSTALNEHDELVIRTDYLVAYAFDAREPSRLDGPLDIVSVVRWEFDYIWIDDPHYDDRSQGMYLGDVDGHHYSVSCRHHDQGLLAPNYLNPPRFGSVFADEDPETYFDPNAPIASDADC